MDKQTLIEKIKQMGASPSCYPDLKEIIQVYLNSLGTANEKFVVQRLLDEIKEDIVTIEQLLIFAHSNSAIERLGAANAKLFAANADALKRSGAKYCNCLACTIGLEVLEHKELLLEDKTDDKHTDKKSSTTRTLNRLADKDIVIR